MTSTTRSSLLRRLQSDGAEAWEEFGRVYRPTLGQLARRMGLRGQDLDELVQCVMVDVYQCRKTFSYDRGKGRFRDYLKKTLVARFLKLHRQNWREYPLSGDLDEPWDDELERRWEEDYRQHVFRVALEQIRRDVEPKTYQAFQLYALDQLDVKEVAGFLDISKSAVYVYKKRVVERLRDIVQELMEE